MSKTVQIMILPVKEAQPGWSARLMNGGFRVSINPVKPGCCLWKIKKGKDEIGFIQDVEFAVPNVIPNPTNGQAQIIEALKNEGLF